MKNQTIVKFLSQLRKLNIQVSSDGEKLRCQAPEDVLTPEISRRIAERKPEILSYLKQVRQKTDSNIPPAISVVPRDKNLPLSFSQERLWFLDQLEGSTAPYIQQGAMEISGNLNIPVLQQAFCEIIRRHEVFRTRFHSVNGIPMQVIVSDTALEISVVDLKHLPKTQQKTEIKQYAQIQGQTPFNLSEDLLLRVSLLQVSQQDFIMLVTMHHIVTDVWSGGILVEELSVLYEAYSQGKPSPLSEVSIQYADFASWQRQWLSAELQHKQLEYWKQQLANAPALLQLPIDKSRPPIQTYEGNIQTFAVGQHLTKQLQELSQHSETTLFMTTFAVFAVFLFRYSAQNDMVIGSLIANRNYSEVESLIGFFANTLPLRMNLQGNLSFEQLLRQVRQVTLSAYAHQDVPFEQVVEALQPERSLSYAPLVQVMYLYQDAPVKPLELSGVTIKPLPQIHPGTSKFELSLSMEQTESGLIGTWEYNTDLFEEQTITRMTEDFQTLLAAVVEAPQERIDKLPLLSERERHQLLIEWNDTAREYPTDKCIHQLFEEQVEKTPDALAVVFENEQLTYQQLNQKANQLAHYLQSLGVGPEVLVGICVERSVEMIVGLLGILKAGGSYVPLDPNHPLERLSYMLADSGVKVLLTQESMVELLPVQTALVVDIDRANWQMQNTQENLEIEVNSSNLAYVIYTSGSTGVPKGVQICHKNVVNFLNSMSNFPGLDQEDTVCAVTTIAFDIAALEIYLPLTVGAKVVVTSREISTNADSLLSELLKSKITVMQATPATWQMLLTAGWSSDYPLKVLCGGEALTAQLANRILETGSELWNLYGPTETTIWSAIYQVPASTTAAINGYVPLSIGQPIANTQIYILDSHLEPVPVGIAGELYIGGEGLGRGYFNRPELTSEKFIPNPFSNSRSECLYKTGDLARYLSDGNIEFIGRIDNQVKVRGFRIELGEIESILNSHSQIQESVVIAQEDPLGNKRLIAYIVSEDELIKTNQLREFLKQKLPEYMVPSAFMTLETLPLTPNGKIDRKALLAVNVDLSLEEQYVAPSTPNQEIIANVFASVLGRVNVGIYDNFFELGGHSLLATQLISRLRQSFEIEIPLRAIFESPTVKQLDGKIIQLRRNGGQFTAPPIKPRGEKEELPLSWSQERLWFLAQLEGTSPTYNIPGAVRISGDLNLKAFEQALSEIVHRHEILQTSFRTVDGRPWQVIEPETTIKINLVDLQQLEAKERESALYQYVQQEAIAPFNLESAPLIRCSLLCLEEKEYALLLTMHHIISDLWSIGVLIEELSSLYQAFNGGEPSPLSELEIQYADFSVWQREWINGQVREAYIDYWKQALNGAPELLDLPTDRPRPSVQTYQGKTQRFCINTDLTDKLQILSCQLGTTLFMTLQAAFATLLYRYSGQSDILIGSIIANRNYLEIESLIGFFANTLVLRNRFEDDPSFETLLEQVKTTTLKAYEYQDIPFEQVVEALQPQRSLSYSPLFQVMFVLQNAPMGELTLPGITISELEYEYTIAKFDLTLSMTQTKEGLVGSWEYNTDLFDDSTIKRMANHFENLLSEIVANPQLTVDEVPLLSEAERHQLLIEWNDTAREYPTDKCIHQLFEDQVEKTPDAVAVVFGQEQLTYHQLNQRANQLANHLQSMGVKPEELVGICVERSIEMMVGLLGILKAGGAYVPLDSNYPQERLSYMLADSDVKVLLTQESLLESLPLNQAQVVCLDRDWQEIEQHTQDNLDVGVCSDNLAYVIYTSGSTGVPKGVSVIHQGVVRLVKETNYASFTSQEVFLQLAPISFDASTFEIWGSLLNGAKLVIMYAHTPTLEEIAGVIEKYKVTTLWLTAALFNLMVEQYLDRLKSVKQLLAGGDVLSPPHVQKVVEFLPECKLINGYGPTENTTFTCCYLVKQSRVNGTSVPIGCPIANTQIYILDKHLQPLPIGVPGELYIGGDGLARGYLNRPELTQEKFIPNPFSNSQSDRLYKTGDLARYLSDGNIEFLGRIDRQVKVRGFRIEPREIEALLSTHPQIQQAVAIATEDLPSNKRLVAYVVSEDESLSTNQLREFLKQKLPEYMVPSAFVTLDTLPLTPNGKIDLKALPAVEAQLIYSKEYVPPRTVTEKTISDIFAAVLKVPAVGLNDNFFELGGHSLIATQLITRLRQVFAVELPLRTLFESPTVAQLDQIISQLTQGEPSQVKASNLDLPTAIAAPSELHQPFPLTEIQQAYWLGRNDTFELGNISSHIYVELDCPSIDIERLSQSWQKIIKHHEMLRMVILPDGQQQILRDVPDYQIEVFDLRRHSENSINAHLETIRQQMSHEISAAESWPLFKFCATQLDTNCYRLHLSFDALIADAWSLMILGQQWLEIYYNPQTELPKVEISFRDYILAELQLKDTPHYQQSQKYWWDRIATLPSAPELPFVQQPAALKQPQFKRFSAKLTAQQWQKLKSKARAINLTGSGILLAAFSDVLAYWSKTPNFTINLTLFNRLPLHPQVNHIVGDFTSLTLLEVDNSIVATFVERAQRLQARLWEDLDHRYVSGVEVQRELRRQRGTYQAMGVVFTSTLGFSDMAQQDWLVNQLGEMVYSITQTPQVWLDHQVREEEGALLFNWDAIEELFPANLLDDMFSSYCNYLQQLATDEKIWMEKYPTLLPPQQLQIIQQLNQVNQLKTVTSEQTLDGLFVQQVKQRGASLAAIAPELCLTYEQLYQHAVKLGHQLRSLGATTGTHIAVVMNKGWEQIVAVLGVLMAGCTYIPIDPGLPQQRQWSLLTQAQIHLVVTQEALYQSLSWPEEIECVYVEYNPHIGVQRTLERLHQPGDLAYIIYTSGSTGIPKGVMIDHQGAVNTIIDINQRFGVTADDRVLAVSALNFDLSVYDIFGTLAAGGTIVIPTAAKAKDPAHWLSLINAHQVTVWNSVPALMQMLVEYTSAQSTPQHHPLRLALLSGDWIPLNLPQQIKAIWTGIEVVSLGGATEASIWSIYYPIGEVDPNSRSIPYGKPLGNQTMHVLNQWMEPAPVWVPGQIYIGGLGLAQGYWKDDEKTAKHFIRHPLTQERLYKTGDLGRYLPDGNIEFLGREDFQVKINGYRIELGEIETTLMRNSLVNKAVVNAIADSRDRKKIVAYIVPSETQPKLPEAYYPSEKEGIITDPVERIEFKLKQPGLRNLDSTNKGIDLPLDIDEEALTQAYFQRQSYRQFQQQPLELPEFSQFLSCLRQLSLADKPLPKYLYPSAGNLYPVQTYLMIKSEGLTGVEEGIYYYCPRQHRLVFLSTLINAEGDNIYGGNQSLVEQAAFSLFLIAKLDAIAPMYGELAERFCLLEAGHIGQLLMTKAPEFGIGLCPIGNLDFQQLSDLFKLDSHQMLLYSFVGGKIEPAQAQQWLTSSVSPAKSSGGSDPISQLRKHLQLHLPDYMLPSKLMLLDALPLSANGKIDRRALPVPDNLHDLEEETFVAPRDLVELKLTQIWSEVLNVFPVGVQSNFFDLGGDSIVAIRLMAQIEEQFQRNLSLATLFQGQTIEKLATVLREESDHISWSPLVPIQTSGYQPPFFCIAGGGGNVLYFYHLSRYLGQEQPFYALQAVGLDGESEPFTRVEDMAAHYIGLIKSIQPEGPYFLGGHSFGGLVAFEVAQQLQKHGNEVALLAILDMHAPYTERPKSGSHKLDTDWNSTKMLTSIANVFGRMFGKNIDVSYEFLQQLTFEEQLNYVNERFQMVNIFPPETGVKQIRGLIKVARASQNAYCYVPQEVCPTQITLFRASDEVPIELAANVDIYRLLYDSRKNDPMWGWSDFSAGEVELHPVPGDHLTIMTEPYIGALAEKLKSSLEKAQTANPMGRP
ncbi:hypothetical protein BJP34_09735 [Moorena producens PAL-8-15-08-1]|uniref:Phenyloxazoline synthase MbtB n=1 Tax=Moorena producens PAL-8-15-08-1 TaxID=1458985 RepID=A0A1D8TPZ2_9CYAN|nr:non-ribosomal peptide synthetase [Moorena producens]AOW99701.1 hypothetical protein BJP34_09735 [Moorena producens PAL-8-15-08-1]